MRNLIISTIVFVVFIPLGIYVITLLPEDSNKIEVGLLYSAAFVFGTLLFSFLNIVGTIFQMIILKLSEKKSKEIYFSLISCLAKISDTEQKDIEFFLKKYYKKEELEQNIEQINNYKKTKVELDIIAGYLLDYKPVIRVGLLYELIAFAVIDGKYSEKEDDFLRSFAKKIKIPEKTFERIKAMFIIINEQAKAEEEKYYFYTNTDKKSKKIFAYKILGINQNATNTEIKKAYYRLAKIHHPDKIKSKKENDLMEATEMFQKISAAYSELVERS